MLDVDSRLSLLLLHLHRLLLLRRLLLRWLLEGLLLSEWWLRDLWWVHGEVLSCCSNLVHQVLLMHCSRILLGVQLGLLADELLSSHCLVRLAENRLLSLHFLWLLAHLNIGLC